MYLKVRDADDHAWVFIHNIDRLKVFDVAQVTPVNSVSPTDAEIIKEQIFAHAGLDGDASINRIVICERLLSQGNFQKILCITDSNHDQPQREYTILFNTVAYLCNDQGQTVEKFLVNSC